MGGLDVADWERRKTRLLSRECDTCVFRPGNPMHLAPGRLKQLVDEIRARETYLVCHSTLPYGPHGGQDGVKPAICRGFKDRYSTAFLRAIEERWGYVEVDPPGE